MSVALYELYESNKMEVVPEGPELETALKWVADNIVPRKTPMYDRTSYGIKHILQDDTGIYFTNGQFKYIMERAGYEACNPNDINWSYRISKKSPAFNRN